MCSFEPGFNKLCIKTRLVWVEFLLIIAMNVQREVYRDKKLVNWDFDPPEVSAITSSFPFLFSDILLAHAGHSWGYNLMRFVHYWYFVGATKHPTYTENYLETVTKAISDFILWIAAKSMPFFTTGVRFCHIWLLYTCWFSWVFLFSSNQTHVNYIDLTGYG